MSNIEEKIWDCAKNGDVDAMTKHLVGAQATQLSFEKDKHCPLTVAACNGHALIVKMLTSAGADINMKDSQIGRTALLWAAERGHADIVQSMLEAGADANAVDAYNWTALMLASAKGHASTVRILVGGKAAVNMQHKDGWTVLILASSNGRTDTAKVLLEAGAKVDTVHHDGGTALMFASQQGQREVVQILLEAGADRSLRNKDNKSAADLAKTPEIRNLINTFVPLPSAIHSSMWECSVILDQFTRVASCNGATQRRDELQRELSALKAAGTDFRAIAAVGKALQAAITAVAQQPLSEEAYLTLAARHAALVQRVTAKCDELADALDFASCKVLGAKLKEVQALDTSALPARGASDGLAIACLRNRDVARPLPCWTDYLSLLAEADVVISQLIQALPLRDALRQRDELQRELSALRAARTDFEAIGEVGLRVLEAIAVVKQQPLSEEDYLTLADRHAALVQRVTMNGRELANAEEYDALDTLAAKLETLKALDVSGLPQSEDSGNNDPVSPQSTAISSSA